MAIQSWNSWCRTRKSLSTVDNNQLGQLDLHDLDLNDLNLAMSALVGCCFFLCFFLLLSFCRDLVLPCFFCLAEKDRWWDDELSNSATWEGIFGEAPQQRPCCTRDPLAMPCWIWNVKDYPKISQMFWSMSTKSLNGKGWFYTRLGILVGGTQKRCNLNAESNLMHIHQFSLMLSEKSQMGKKKCLFFLH